jgi:hypothetical protein
MTTTRPQPATLLQLRQRVQAEIDRMVHHAPDSYRFATNVPRRISEDVRRKARVRIHAWLAARLNLREFQVNRLDKADAQMALYLLKTNSFAGVREWAKKGGL